jgi:hypothetical protein
MPQGDNHHIQKYLRENSSKMRCKLEFKAPDSPQKNGKTKRKFATLFGRVRAILNGAEFTPALRNVMLAFCSIHAARLDNSLILPGTHLSPYEMYCKEHTQMDTISENFWQICYSSKTNKGTR